MAVTKSYAEKENTVESASSQSETTSFTRPTVVGNVFSMTDKTRQHHNKLLTRKRKKSRHPLRELRLQRGYTLEELADLTRLSPSYLSRLESGSRRLNADILNRIALVLSCHPGDLLPHDSHTSKFVSQTQRPTDVTSFSYPQDLPLHYIEASNDKRTLAMDQIQEWIHRPAEIAGTSHAFAFSPKGISYGPRYSANDRVYTHPSKSLTPNCQMLALTYDEEAFVGQFLGWKEGSTNENSILEMRVFEEKDNNFISKIIQIKKGDLKACLRIVGTMEAA